MPQLKGAARYPIFCAHNLTFRVGTTRKKHKLRVTRKTRNPHTKRGTGLREKTRKKPALLIFNWPRILFIYLFFF